MSEHWLVETLRFTLFPSPNQVYIDKELWWEKTTGESPETVEERPREAGYKALGQLTESSNLVLNTAPDRIDWILYPRQANDQKIDFPFPMIGYYEDYKSQFTDLILKWINLVDLRVLRIAFGATLILPVDNHEEAYIKLSEFMTAVQIDPDNSSDFNYSINRPRQSLSASELNINRLSKWSAIKTVLSRISPTEGSSINLNEKYACRLELDINNVSIDAEISGKEKIKNLFIELISLSEEISSKGDIA